MGKLRLHQDPTHRVGEYKIIMDPTKSSSSPAFDFQHGSYGPECMHVVQPQHMATGK